MKTAEKFRAGFLLALIVGVLLFVTKCKPSVWIP